MHNHFEEDPHFDKHHHHSFDDAPHNNSPIKFDKIVTSRHEHVTFTTNHLDDARGEIHDKGLGPEDELYVPLLKPNHALASTVPPLEDYFPRIIQANGPSVTTNIFYPGPIEVKCITADSVMTLSYTPQIPHRKKLDPRKLEIKRTIERCAPLLTTEHFEAHYCDHLFDSIISSSLTFEEEDNHVAKIVFAKDGLIRTKHTGNTSGKKGITFTVYYDDGFRLRTERTVKEYEISSSEINARDDNATVVNCASHPNTLPPDGYDYPKVYVLCTKRCIESIANANGVYEVGTNNNSGGGYL